jgi:antitoxin FitA
MNCSAALHKNKIKARAAQSGMTLSDHLLDEIERLAALPTRDEMVARLHAPPREKPKTPAAEVIRKERESA